MFFLLVLAPVQEYLKNYQEMVYLGQSYLEMLKHALLKVTKT